MTDYYAPQSPGTLNVDAVVRRIAPDGDKAGVLPVEFAVNYLAELRRQDNAAQSVPVDEYWFRTFRTYVKDLGRNSGSALMAQMVMDEATLVYAPDVRSFDLLNSCPPHMSGTGASTEGLWETAVKAKVVNNVTAFLEELHTGKYNQAIAYGTDGFQGYLSRGLTELREECAKHLQGELPRLFVLG